MATRRRAAREKYVVEFSGKLVEGPFLTHHAAVNYAVEIERIYGDDPWIIIAVYPPKVLKDLRVTSPLRRRQ